MIFSERIETLFYPAQPLGLVQILPDRPCPLLMSLILVMANHGLINVLRCLFLSRFCVF